MPDGTTIIVHDTTKYRYAYILYIYIYNYVYILNTYMYMLLICGSRLGGPPEQCRTLANHRANWRTRYYLSSWPTAVSYYVLFVEKKRYSIIFKRSITSRESFDCNRLYKQITCVFFPTIYLFNITIRPRVFIQCLFSRCHRSSNPSILSFVQVWTSSLKDLVVEYNKSSNIDYKHKYLQTALFGFVQVRNIWSHIGVF